MSGPEGGGGGGGGGYPPPEQTSCEDVGGESVLTSPDPAVLKKLKPGDCLSVELHKEKGVTVAAALYKKEIAGIIPGAQYNRLLSCLTTGHKYHAIVKSIQGGMCTVDLGHGKCP